VSDGRPLLGRSELTPPPPTPPRKGEESRRGFPARGRVRVGVKAPRSGEGGEGEPGGEWPHVSGRLEGDTHLLPVRVYYEDTDFSGVVYHASYLRFLERGRTELVRALGVAQSDLHSEIDGLAFAVRRMVIDFTGAAVMDDVLTVRTRPKEIRGASMILRQEIKRGDSVLVTADVTVAAVRKGRAVRIPDGLRQILLGSNSSSFRGREAEPGNHNR
jgi:acyl-CoA thioester hydrolase